MAWLEEEDLDDWIQVLNYEGEVLGWARGSYCRHLNLQFQTIETPHFFKEHPWIVNHALMAYESGALKARDYTGLSDIQIILLSSILVRHREEAEALRKRKFEEDLIINNAELYRVYREQQDLENFEEFDGVVIEERVPQNIEEFLAALSAFDGAEISEEESESSGWLDTMLSDDELEMMGE